MGTVPVPPAAGATVLDVCTNALFEINAFAPGEAVPAADANFVASKLYQVCDSWSAQPIYIFASQLIDADPQGNPFLFTPGLALHTIGPAGTITPNFVLPVERPVRIVSANVIQQNVSPVVRFPMMKRDKDWWAKQRVQTIQTTLPTDFYYRPDWPLGALFFWPVPNFAYQVEFEIETVIALTDANGVSLVTAFAMPPGYMLALTLTLAEAICNAYEKSPSPSLVNNALRARQAIIGNNTAPPRINLDDFGAPSTQKPRASFNYHTGLDR